MLLIVGCGSNSIKEERTGNASFNLKEKQFVHTLFLTEYLWYEDTPNHIDYDTFKKPNDMVSSLRTTHDRWSYTITQEEFENFSNQKTKGFGFRFTSDFRVVVTLIGAPAYGKLFRGDKILEINGKEPTRDSLTEASNSTSATIFKVLRGGSDINVQITSQNYSFKVVLGKILSQGSKKVGYLRYDSFTGTSVDELEKEFTKFKDENIDELVIDLRYNGGGSVSVASILLDNLSNAQPGERQGYLDWNKNYKHKNENFYFSDDIEPNDLNMKRLFFLVTENSASASELVISALKPYLGDTNVITIGTNTHGKNVGMEGKSYGNNYYFLINFLVKNDHGETTSADGIPVTCAATDDLNHMMGDANESMFKTALYYIETGNCL